LHAYVERTEKVVNKSSTLKKNFYFPKILLEDIDVTKELILFCNRSICLESSNLTCTKIFSWLPLGSHHHCRKHTSFSLGETMASTNKTMFDTPTKIKHGKLLSMVGKKKPSLSKVSKPPVFKSSSSTRGVAALVTAASRQRQKRIGGGQRGGTVARLWQWQRQRGGGGGSSAAMAAARRRCGGGAAVVRGRR
jgi:hypothetical protein